MTYQKLSNAFVFPDQEPPIINILYIDDWKIGSKFGFCIYFLFISSIEFGISLSSNCFMSVIFAVKKTYVLYLRCQDMSLSYHQIEVCYLFHQDYALQSIVCNSVKFMIIASNAYLVFYCGFISYIVNAFIKIMKCQLFRCILVLCPYKFRVLCFKIILFALYNHIFLVYLLKIL